MVLAGEFDAFATDEQTGEDVVVGSMYAFNSFGELALISGASRQVCAGPKPQTLCGALISGANRQVCACPKPHSLYRAPFNLCPSPWPPRPRGLGAPGRARHALRSPDASGPQAGVRARTDGTLMVIGKEDYISVLQGNTAKCLSDKVDFLSQLPALKGMSRASVLSISYSFHKKWGEKISSSQLHWTFQPF